MVFVHPLPTSLILPGLTGLPRLLAILSGFHRLRRTPFQIKNAKKAYVKALEYNKNHAKALQQLGWLHYKDEDDFRSAIEYLKRASEIGTGLHVVFVVMAITVAYCG